MSEKPEPKFRVGQTVYFTNSRGEEYECVVESISTGYQGATVFLPYDVTIYWVRWPYGHTAAREDHLSAEATSGSRPAA